MTLASSPPSTPNSGGPNTGVDIIGRSRIWATISALILMVGLISMAFNLAQFGQPLRLGLDFSGGTLLEVRFEQPVKVEAIRSTLAPFGSSVVQLDTETAQTALIRLQPLSEPERLKAEAALKQQVGSFERNRIETVGPTIGKMLLRVGLISVGLSFLLIMIYLAFRFQAAYAVIAIIALFHDILLTVGIFALLGLTLGIEVDSLFLVALLTIIGFSVNDTVVIYDRIRENLRLRSRKMGFADVVNLSLNQTFARSINTTLTTMLSLLAILWFGGPTLKGFSLALLIGFGLGAYSSIFIASPLLVWWQERQRSTGVSSSLPESSLAPESDVLSGAD